MVPVTMMVEVPAMRRNPAAETVAVTVDPMGVGAATPPDLDDVVGRLG
jgi:hypothetical protein